MLPAVVVALVACMAASTAAYFDPNTVIRGVNISQAGCSPLGVKSDQLCETSGFNNNTVNPGTTCFLLAIAEDTLIASAPDEKRCTGNLQSTAVAESPGGRRLPYPLVDSRPMAHTLPTALVEKDGASLYWLYRNVQNFQQWTSCAATNTPKSITPGTPVTGDPNRDWHVPAGWTVHSTLWQPDGGPVAGVYWPFATVIHKGKQVVVIIRGTETGNDWKSNLDYVLAPSSPLMPLPGRLHRGMNGVATDLWPGIQSAIRTLWHKEGIRHMYVTGHSLGAGVATMISYAAQEYLNELYEASLDNECGKDNTKDSYDYEKHYSQEYYKDYNGKEYQGYGDKEPEPQFKKHYDDDTEHHNKQYHSKDDSKTYDEDDGKDYEKHYPTKHHMGPIKVRRRYEAAEAQAGDEDADGAEAETDAYDHHGGSKPPHPPHKPRVDAALFAAPDVSDAVFAAAFGKLVNSRNIDFLFDPVPQVPCHPMIGCPSLGTNTTENGGMWPYAQLPAIVLLLPDGMPVNQHEWSLFGKIYPCQVARLASAVHTCSYMCYFTKFVNDQNNLCRLWNQTTSTGSYCYGFPDASGYPFDH